MEKQKGEFFLFRRKKDGKYEYIQHLVSASHDDGLSTSCWPEYAWRGQTSLDVRKMKYLISISDSYKDDVWQLVKFEMDVETPSWAAQPKEKVEYESLFITGRDKLEPLTDTEKEELERYKIKAFERYGKK